MKAHKKPWTKEEKAVVYYLFPFTQTAAIAKMLRRGYSSIANQALKMGLKKSERFMNSLNSGRILKAQAKGIEHRYPKGHVPFNKGKKMADYASPEAIERISKTMFPKGHKPANHKPVGSLRIDCKDGYVLVKTAEGMNKWRLLHRVIWEHHNGPLPKGHNVRFRDGNISNFELDNLVLVSKSENMNMNTIHRLPADLKKAIIALKVLKITINKHQKV